MEALYIGSVLLALGGLSRLRFKYPNTGKTFCIILSLLNLISLALILPWDLSSNVIWAYLKYDLNDPEQAKHVRAVFDRFYVPEVFIICSLGFSIYLAVLDKLAIYSAKEANK